MKFNQTTYALNENESVLDVLLRHAEEVSYACKSGSCQGCFLARQQLTKSIELA